MFKDKKFRAFAVAVILGVFSLSVGFASYGQNGDVVCDEVVQRRCEPNCLPDVGR